MRLALLDDHAGPALAAAQNRRGLIVYVAARPVDRAAARARPHARRLPARDPRRARRTAARCSRSPAATATSARRTGSAAADGGGERRRERRAAASARSRGTGAARCRSAEPDAGRRSPHVLRAARAAAAARRRARRSRSSRSPRSARCTGCRCSSRPRPARALGRASASALLAMLRPAARRAGCPAAARARRGGRGRRSPALALALLAGGVADELLLPGRWGELAAGIARGIAALPGVRVPYRGLDEWMRLVIPLGGTVLVVLAALLAFWPRRGRARLPDRRAACCCDALRRAGRRARLRRASSCAARCWRCSCVAFLRLERLRLTDGRRRPRCSPSAARSLGADRRARARRATRRGATTRRGRSTTAASKSTDVHLGPRLRPARLAARRPRAAARQGQAARLLEGREPRRLRRRALARVGAGTRDGRSTSSSRRPTRGPRALDARRSRSPSATCARDTFVTAGITSTRRTCRGRAAIPTAPPASATSSRARCAAATPTRPSLHAAADRARAARRAAPTTTGDAATLHDASTSRPSAADPGARGRPGAPVASHVPGVGEPGAPTATAAARPGPDRAGGRAAARAPTCARTYALAAAAASDGARRPYDYVQRRRGLPRRDGFTYTESPPPASRTLDGFLFDAKPGYCQQYSGAMALLLRMGGIPARVATGFTSGSLDRKAERVRRARPRRPLVGRGLVPGLRLGHVRPDARPPRRRARSRGDRSRAGAAPRRRAATSAATRARPAAAAPRRSDGGTPWAPDRRSAALAARAGRRRAWLAAPPPAPPRRAAGRSPSSSARCARTRRTPARATTLQRARGALRALARGGRATCARCASSATRGRRRRARRARSAAACAPSWAAAAGSRGRLRAWWALPPRRRPSGAAYTRSADGRRLRPLPARDGLLEDGRLPRRRPCRWRKARDLEPDKTSIREALGRAYFRSRQFEEARAEFEAVVERAPTNDYALFCLGRSLMRAAAARGGAQAARAGRGLRPDRRDYRIYRDRARDAPHDGRLAGAITEPHSFRRRPVRPCFGKRALARFFVERREVNMSSDPGRHRGPARRGRSPRSRSCSPRSSAASSCACSSTIPTASRSSSASA